jgi:5-formyltetrahydrofolate cyclo-ligase
MKDALRKKTWAALEDSGDARFPGTVGRIPNFRGAEAAADRLMETDVWKRATRIKVNPDSPHRPVRHRALKQGKRLYVAVPKLAEAIPFLELDPAVIPSNRWWHATSIGGAAELGRPCPPEEVEALDLIVTGCVGVTRQGARLGKGGGYSDLEYAVLRELGLVQADTPIVTTVHPVQILADDAIPMLPHDISLDLFCTPTETVHCPRPYARPDGVLDDILPAEKRAAIPVLQR